jgi:hypothetical protein
MQALVELAVTRGVDPFIDTLTSTKDEPFIAIDLADDGRPTFKALPEGTTVRGFKRYSRTGLNYVPRPFRDSAEYTIEPGPRRDAYAQMIEKMAANHPRSRGLAAFLTFLQRKQRLPAAVQRIVADPQKKTIFVPRYRGRLLFDAVAGDIENGDVYRAPEGPTQVDVVTGGICIVPRERPIRVTGIGQSTGVTLMSVDDDTTLCHGWGGADRHLRVPVSERTMNLHVRGLQMLVDEGVSVQVCGPLTDKGCDGAVRHFAWTGSGREGADAVLLGVLRGEATLDNVEAAARRLSRSRDSLCVLGLREGKRIQYVAWHFLPENEAMTNVLEFAQAHHRPDGTVLGIRDVARACVPVDLAFDDDRYKESQIDAFADKRCPSSFLVALIDHVVDGTPFPAAIQIRTRAAYATQKAHRNPDLTRWFGTQIDRHLDNQEAIMEMRR